MTHGTSKGRYGVQQLEEVSPFVEPPTGSCDLLTEARDGGRSYFALKERGAHAEHRIRAANTLLSCLQVSAVRGIPRHISNRPNLQEGGWWGVGGVVSFPLSRLSNPDQVGGGHRPTTGSPRPSISPFRRTSSWEVKDSFFDVVTLIQR